jgi:hypothetical protein
VAQQPPAPLDQRPRQPRQVVEPLIGHRLAQLLSVASYDYIRTLAGGY